MRTPLTRKKVWTLVALLLLMIALVAATARLMLWPKTDQPRPADAVVVLAGGPGERLAKALELMRRDSAPVLAISNGEDPRWLEANRLCRGTSAAFDVICFRPHPDNTRGEARTLAALAKRRRWDSLLVVTSTYHLTRARLLLTRCYEGDVRFVAAAPATRILRTLMNITREWAGLAKSFARGC